MSLKSPFKPNKFRKYQDSADTYRTSMSGVAISLCNIALNP